MNSIIIKSFIFVYNLCMYFNIILIVFCTETVSSCNNTTTKVKREAVDKQAPLTSPRKPRRGRVKVEYEEEEGAELKRERWEPRDWRTQLSFIREMRSKRDAPVDQMGAEKCYDTEAPPEVSENQSQIT